MFLYDVSELDRGYRIVSFIVLGVLLLAISFVYQRDWLESVHPKQFCGEVQAQQNRAAHEYFSLLVWDGRALVAPSPEGPSISYFTNVRESVSRSLFAELLCRG